MKSQLSCLLCKKLLSDNKDLQDHFSYHDLSELKRFPCHLCDIKFVKFSTLEKHLQLVHLKKSTANYNRQSSDLTRLRQEALNLFDIKVQDNGDPELSPDENCGSQDLNTNADLQEENAGFNQKKKIYKCEVEGCGKTFHHMTSFIMHGRCVHSDERSFCCQICSKAFKTSSNLNVHIKMHNNQRDHPCTICKQSFFTSSHLKAHMKIHRNEPTYKCQSSGCDKTFIHLSSFKKHKNFHDGVKNHHCSVCQRDFSQACHLREHLKIHSNERNHTCDKCSKAFRRPDTLRIHRRTHDS